MDSTDVYNYLMAERMFLFVAQGDTICGAFTCEIVQYLKKRVIRIVHLSGENFMEWQKEVEAPLVAWAQSIGAVGLEAFVRPGFEKFLKQAGSRVVQLKMYKDVPNGI
jgi:hypothetical protein